MTTTSTYQDWARSFHGRAFARRSAATNAAFLLPHLRPTDRLLDVGCGPGSITLGLADHVGEVVGVDVDDAFLADARTRAGDRTDVRFERADVCDRLPFDDDAFDVAFLHAVLQHVESPTAALSEVRRVVRPGGRVGIGDPDVETVLLHPRTPALDGALAIESRTRRNPDIGRRLPELLTNAGFDDVQLAVRPNVALGRDAVTAIAQSTAMRLEAEPFIAHAVAQEWATRDEIPSFAQAWREWAEAPGAVFVTLWCEALAT